MPFEVFSREVVFNDVLPGLSITQQGIGEAYEAVIPDGSYAYKARRQGEIEPTFKVGHDGIWLGSGGIVIPDANFQRMTNVITVGAVTYNALRIGLTHALPRLWFYMFMDSRIAIWDIATGGNPPVNPSDGEPFSLALWGDILAGDYNIITTVNPTTIGQRAEAMTAYGETVFASNRYNDIDVGGGAHIKLSPNIGGITEAKGRVFIAAFGDPTGGEPTLSNTIGFFTRSGVDTLTERMRVLSAGGLDMLGYSLQNADYIELGANPAHVGQLRLTSGSWVNCRNNADTDDLFLFRANPSDQLEIGRPIALGGHSMINFGGWVTGDIAGIAKTISMNFPIVAGGGASNALILSFELDSARELGLIAETDGAGSYRYPWGRIPYAEQAGGAWAAPTSPGAIENGCLVLAGNTNGGILQDRIYAYSRAGVRYVTFDGGWSFPERKCSKCDIEFKAGDVILAEIDKDIGDGFHSLPMHYDCILSMVGVKGKGGLKWMK